jgi:hypothetical protein
MNPRQGDRTVHAEYDGMEIVRYDRAGKWYLEPTDRSLKRQAVSIRAAAATAIWGLDNGGRVFLRLPGGGMFDRLIEEARW